MTPKEKADRLCMDMLFQIEYNCQPSICKMVAKQCALIAVDEIIDALDKSLIDSDIEWWKEVKQEIKKL